MNYRRIFPIVAGALFAFIAYTSPAEASHCNEKACFELDPPFSDVCIGGGFIPTHCIGNAITCMHDEC